MSKAPEITIGLGSSLNYYGHFVDVIRRRYAARVRLTSNIGFGRISPKGGLAIETPDRLRLFISADDMADDWNESALDWCDAYGVVNADLHRWPAPTTSTKVVLLGPSFGFRSLTRPLVAKYVGATAIQHRLRPRMALGVARQEVRFSQTRPRLDDYPRSNPQMGRVYHVSKFWPDHHDANLARALFLEQCSDSPLIDLRGGFVFDQGPPTGEFASLASVATPRISATHYLEQLALSAFAFSSPAVHGCLGWKLGEYFAMGKAIMTTPLGRDLPAPLLHGEHVFLVRPERDAIRAAVEQLAHDRDLIETLQSGAEQYWNEHLRPDRQVERMIGVARGNHA